MSRTYKLLSIDVWDTLIRRYCHPECIKLSVAQHVYLRFADSLHTALQDPWKLYEERLKVERFLANDARTSGKDDEYVLDMVIEQWLKRIFVHEPAKLSDLVHELEELEFGIECERSFPDPHIKALMEQYPAEETIFLSDFYMRSSMLRRLLEHHGVAGFSRPGVSSCDIGLNKRSGKLFTHIHSEFDVKPSEHVHIGDNAHSDVAMPQQLGITAVNFLPEEGHRQREHRERLFSSRSGLFSYLQEHAVAAAQTHLSETGEARKSAFLAGVQAAPLFIGFGLFIAERSLRDKVEHLFFQTREGEFFIRVYSALFPQGRLAGLDLPGASVLEVSRLATFTASLREGSIEELNRTWRLLQRQSPAALFKTLGLPIEKHAAILEQCGLVAGEMVERPWDDARVSKLLAHPEFKQSLKDKIQEDRSLLIRYLAARGVIGKKCVGLVDIGWRGTIQDNIATVVPDVFFHGYYLGLQRYLNSQEKNVSKAAFGPDTNVGLDHIHLLDSIAPLEMLCISSFGSVEGYVMTEDGVKTLRRIDESENVSYEKFSKSFQDGVVFAAQSWQPYLENYAVASNELRGVAMRIWQSLCENSSSELVEACLSSTQNDVFGFGDFIDRKDLPSLGKIFRGFYSGADRRDIIQYIKRTQWPSAIQHRKDINAFHRQVLLQLIGLARNYKHLRLKYAYLKGALNLKIKKRP
jgi:FMN phosphatase YigB (HAD superfamily)